MPLGLYIHVPFCHARCSFCSFYLEIHREADAARYVTALQQELTLYGKLETVASRRLETVYFGGGTPTSLDARQLAALLHNIREQFDVAPAAEITVEAHPDTLDASVLSQLLEAGFNRISVGIQSLVDHERRALGRPSIGKGVDAVSLSAREGFRNINVDVMYGLPGQTLASWVRSLDEILSLPLVHLSCYALTVEDATRLQVQVSRGLLAEPDEQVQLELLDAATARLVSAGLVRYEISNFARPGYECHHNLLYWTDGDYLGLGPSAQSFVGGVRFGNVAALQQYEAALREDRLPIEERERLCLSQRRREAVAFGLRRLDGVPRSLVEAALQGEGPEGAHRQAFERFVELGLLQATSARVSLTAAGLRLADSIAAALI